MKLLRHITDQDITSEDTFTYTSPRRAARAALLDSEGKLALMYVGRLDFYTLPGGGMEEGEDVMTTLHREMLEETGCECEITGELGYTIENKARMDFTQHSFYFYGRVTGEKGQPSFTDEEVSDETVLGWYTLSEALRLVADKKQESYQCRYIQARDSAALEALRKILSK
ncbi:MAG: NUDIX hydrolase [Eubacteriales bacterium]